MLGVELVPKIAALYKHPCIIADVLQLDGRRFKGFDLIVGSPPCRDFSRMSRFKHWKIPADPEDRGMELVNAFLNIVQTAKPRFWLLENVLGLEKYIKIAPRCHARLSKTMIRGFWGNYPAFLLPKQMGRALIVNIQGPNRKWERARIPLPVARALGRAVKGSIL